MAVSVSQPLRSWSYMKIPILDALDVMSSKSSTFPYDDDTMKRMIGLVQRAKSTPV